jgi:hypothetical protein
MDNFAFLLLRISESDRRGISLFCHSPKNGGQTLILSLGVVGCNDGNSSEFRKVTEEGYPVS